MSRFLGFIVLLVSSLVVYGWFADIDFLKRIVPGLVTMKISTAFSFILSGLMVVGLGLSLKHRTTATSLLCFIPASWMFLVMGGLLLDSLFNLNLRIENIIVKEQDEAIMSVAPGFPSIGTIVLFLLISSVGMIFQSFNNYMGIRIISALVLGLSVLAVIGYVVNIPLLYLYIPGISTAMAIHTAVLFLLTGISLFLISGEVHHNDE